MSVDLWLSLCKESSQPFSSELRFIFYTRFCFVIFFLCLLLLLLRDFIEFMRFLNIFTSLLRLFISSSIGNQLSQECWWAGSEHYLRTHITEPPCCVFKLYEIFLVWRVGTICHRFLMFVITQRAPIWRNDSRKVTGVWCESF